MQGTSYKLAPAGIHEYTRINNKIFDNNNPNGVLDSEYFNKFAVQGNGFTIREIEIKD